MESISNAFNLIFDSTLLKIYKSKWMFDKEIVPYLYEIPKHKKLIKNENNELYLVKFASYYKHNPYISNYNLGFCYYFGFFNLVQIYLSYKLYRKFHRKGIILLSAIYTAMTCLEINYLYNRIKDVKEATYNKENQIITITSFSDEKFYLKVSDFRIWKFEEICVFVYRQNSKLIFFVLEPEHGNLPNRDEVFSYVFKDQRNLQYL